MITGLYGQATLGQHTFFDMSVNIGQAELSPLIAEGQFLVIDTAEGDSGLHVVNMNGILGDIPSEFIALPVSASRFHSSSRHDPAEGPAEVIPPCGFLWVA